MNRRAANLSPKGRRVSPGKKLDKVDVARRTAKRRITLGQVRRRNCRANPIQAMFHWALRTEFIPFFVSRERNKLRSTTGSRIMPE